MKKEEEEKIENKKEEENKESKIKKEENIEKEDKNDKLLEKKEEEKKIKNFNRTTKENISKTSNYIRGLFNYFGTVIKNSANYIWITPKLQEARNTIDNSIKYFKKQKKRFLKLKIILLKLEKIL